MIAMKIDDIIDRFLNAIITLKIVCFNQPLDEN